MYIPEILTFGLKEQELSYAESVLVITKEGRQKTPTFYGHVRKRGRGVNPSP